MQWRLYLLAILFVFAMVHLGSADEITDIAKELASKIDSNIVVSDDQLDLLKRIYEVINNSRLSVSRRLYMLRPIMMQLYNKQQILGLSGNMTANESWNKQRGIYEKLIDENDKLSKRLDQNKVPEAVRELEWKIQDLTYDPAMYTKNEQTVLNKFEEILRKYPIDIVLQLNRIKKNLFVDVRRNEPLVAIKALTKPMPNDLTRAQTSRTGYRPSPVPLATHTIVYLFPLPEHKGTAKVINIYRDDICYDLTQCIDFSPRSSIVYAPPDWCLCYSDARDCTGAVSCWKNPGTPTDLGYDGFEHIQSISVRSTNCYDYTKNVFTRRYEGDLEILRCDHTNNPPMLIGDDSDDYILPHLDNRPLPILPTVNNIVVYLFEHVAHAGKGNVFNWYSTDTCHDLTKCNIPNPMSAIVYMPSGICVCASENIDCTGNTVCWTDRGWAGDFSWFGLKTIQSVSVQARGYGCNNYHMQMVSERRVPKWDDAC